jgi:RNA polymerase sigma factor (sigma-70 family)
MTPKSLLAPARLAGVPLLRSQSDGRLVDLVRAGNDAAFEAIVARYRRPLLRHCTRLLSEERAEDVVQQAFVRALAAMRRDERPLDLKPWLYTIAHNAALNALRERAVPSDSLEEEIDGVERPEQAFERREGLRAVVAAVGALPARQRDALVLRELEGRSYDEIARELGVSNGAVRQLLNRARTTLRAGITAITPIGLLLRIPPGGNEPLTARVAEMGAAGAGVGTVAAKAAVSALVAGAVIGGIATAPQSEGEAPRPPKREAVADAARRDVAAAVVPAGREDSGSGPSDGAGHSGRSSGGPGGSSSRGGESGEDHGGGRGETGDDRSGHSGGDDSGGGGSSGPGSGSEDRSGSNSGPGSGDSGSNSGPGSTSSGPGDGGSGSSGSGTSGSGDGSSGSSGSGSSGSGSGSLSSGSGSLNSGSGSLSSGSGPSGSGSTRGRSSFSTDD